MRSSCWRSLGVSQSDTSGSCAAGNSVLRLSKAAPPHGVDPLARGFEICRPRASRRFFWHITATLRPDFSPVNTPEFPANSHKLPCITQPPLTLPYVPLLPSEIYRDLFPPSLSLYAAWSV